jgi:hypothetical protein
VVKRSYGLFIASIAATPLGGFFSFIGLVVINIIAIVIPAGGSFSLRGINIAMIVLGAVAILMSFVYFIAMPQVVWSWIWRRGVPENTNIHQNQMPPYPTGSAADNKPSTISKQSNYIYPTSITSDSV